MITWSREGWPGQHPEVVPDPVQSVRAFGLGELAILLVEAGALQYLAQVHARVRGRQVVPLHQEAPQGHQVFVLLVGPVLGQQVGDELAHHQSVADEAIDEIRLGLEGQGGLKGSNMRVKLIL